jgi:hypothetical protein
MIAASIAIGLAFLLVGQHAWMSHQKGKARDLQRHFLWFASEFNKGLWQTDAPRYHEFLTECISLERLCVDAQVAIRNEMWVYPWQWFSRWNVDYFLEQKTARPRYCAGSFST